MEEGWYIAKLVLLCQVGNDDPGPWLCDEQVRVIRAISKSQAYEKAVHLGKDAEHTYTNDSGEMVSWSFLGLSDLDVLGNDVIGDGTEITYRLFDTDDPLALVRDKKVFVSHPTDVNGEVAY